jgi:flagellar hook-length control protein FliK
VTDKSRPEQDPTIPNLAFAPSASAPAVAAAASGKAALASDAAGDISPGSPFATVLQEQLAAQILMPVPDFVGLPAVESAEDAPAEDTLALMLGLAAPSAATDGAAQPPSDEVEAPLALILSGETQIPDPLATDTTAMTLLALPAIGIQPQQAQQEVGTGDTPRERPAATSTASATAILAAAADSSKAGGNAVAAGKAEEALTAVAADTAGTRAEALSQSHAQASASRAAEQAVRIEAPVGSRQWDGEFANRLAWMVGKQEQRADLVLTPPQLGRIEVSLSVNGEQATAIFTSASATVRDAIENALPRLREVLLESGITLGQAQVGSESPQQSPTRDENRDNRGNALAAGQDSRGMPTGFAANSPTAWVSSGRGMIDVFA